MPRRSIKEFREQRCAAQERVLETEHLGIKRFFSLDSAAYRDGALPGRTKELLGLVASTVLRCNDCIDYHLEQCVKHGFDDEQIEEALNVALVVGGSIVIPHLRHARWSLDELFAEKAAGELTCPGDST
jgi:AhpD family alkylhydroperoxidase